MAHKGEEVQPVNHRCLGVPVHFLIMLFARQY